MLLVWSMSSTITLTLRGSLGGCVTALLGWTSMSR
jgi:hypothetical protein